MSLKAKIEAVIYASEEPVTLAQLTGLLGEEGQAELDALAAQQQSLALDNDAPADDAAANDAAANEDGADEDEYALNAETLNPTDIPEPDAAAEPTPTPEPDAPTTEPEAVELADAPADDKTLAREAAAAAKLRDAEQKLAARKLRDYFRSLLDQLIADYANGDRGLEIREVAGGFRLGTKAEYHDAVRGFVKSLKPPLKLTLQALETLAVVAYKQPVTAPEVSEIRGVDSAGVLGSLLTRKLVTTAGRKQVIGRPILYKTTKDFLLRFGLKDINELPSIEEFEKMAGELNEAVQEEIQMESSEPRPEGSEESSESLNETPEAPESPEAPEAPEAELSPSATAETAAPSVEEPSTVAPPEPDEPLNEPQA